MTWNLVAQLGTLMIVGGFVVSGVAGDILARINKGKMELADKALEVAKAHVEAHQAQTRERMPWDVN